MQPCSKVPVIFSKISSAKSNFNQIWANLRVKLDNNQCLVSVSVSTTCVCKKSNLKLGVFIKICKKYVFISHRLLLLKCFDIKMVKLPGCSSVGASLCSWPTKKNKKK